jgi:hypothetical protein
VEHRCITPNDAIVRRGLVPKTHRKGSSGCTRVGMATCLVRLNNECTPTWGSRRVRANHTRHDPGRSVSHARATLSAPRSRLRWLQSPRDSAYPEKTRANNNSHQQMACRNRAAPEFVALGRSVSTRTCHASLLRTRGSDGCNRLAIQRTPKRHAQTTTHTNRWFAAIARHPSSLHWDEV